MSSQTEVEESQETYLYGAPVQLQPSSAMIPPQQQIDREEIPSLVLPPPMYQPETEELGYEDLLEIYPPPPSDLDITDNENLNPNNNDNIIITIEITQEQLEAILLLIILNIIFIAFWYFGVTFRTIDLPAGEDRIKTYLENLAFFRHIEGVMSRIGAEFQHIFWWVVHRVGALLVVKMIFDLCLETLDRGGAWLGDDDLVENEEVVDD